MSALNTFAIAEPNLPDIMEEKLKALYRELRRDSTQSPRGTTITLEDTETGYKVALDYWQKVKALLRETGFRSEEQEMQFFSGVKPHFTGQLEYFMLLYQHRLFCPPGRSDTGAFRLHEIDKIQRFRDLHAKFIHFYHNRANDPVLASQYFLRRTFNPEGCIYSRPFDANPDYLTNGDCILTRLIGNLRYYRFLLSEACK
jgi:hypothetical protein